MENTLLSIVKPKCMYEVLIGATVRNIRFRNIRFNGIKVKVYRRIYMFKQALCEVIISLLPDNIMRM